VSNLFLLHGQRKFHDYPFIQYQLLDIERDPGEQGLTAHQFDVILASHVLHATSDLRRTLRHVQQLLTSQGLLVLLEGEGLHGMYDLVFGMTEGWWKFADADLRPLHPLLSQRQWREVLEEVGFTEAVAVPQRETCGEGDWSRQVVVLARGPQVAREAQREETVSILPERRGSWLIFADNGDVGQQLAELLRSHSERCVMVFPAETYEVAGVEHYHLNPGRPEEFHRLLKDALGSEQPPCRGVVHLWSLEAAPLEETTVASLEAAQVLGCGSMLHLVQALAEVDWTESPRLWLVTHGAQAVEAGTEPVSVAQAPLWGLGRVIAMEHPELRCTNVDVSLSAAPEELRSLFQEFWAGDHEDQIALRGEVRYVHRLVRRAPESTVAKRRIASGDQPFRLEISPPGILDNLTLRATTRRAPGAGEVEIQVYAAGLNFLDVLSALGFRPDQPDSRIVQLGIECAGKITALGEGVKDFHVGDEVIAIAPSSFSSFVTTAAALVVPKPAHLSFEGAATVPVAFLTAYYALHHLGRLGKGERVLIHAAAGGVGLAAVQLAQRAGAEIFATAGSPGKREFLRSLGIEQVMDSRSLAFADAVLERTGGQGVDVVLNSLAGEAIPKSLSTLRANGRFLEIGKRDIYQNSQLEMGYLRNNVSFFAIDLVPMLTERPDFCATMLRELEQGFANGTLRPLPLQVFPISEVESAFRYMAQAKHIGKIVVSLQAPEVCVAPAAEATARFRSDATYLITGGLGGFGLTVAQWMVEQGARHLVLMGRSAPSAVAREALEAMRRVGAQVVVAQADVTQEQQVASVVSEIGRSMPPLCGVIHAAMVLDDASLRQLNLDRFQKVMAPKLIGAWNLHTLTWNAPLDFFVLFSSSAALAGSPGQANYVAANVGLDALAHYRRAQGLPALSINWGRLAEVGYVARHDEIGQRLERLGVKAFTAKQAVTILARLLQLNPIQMGVMRTDWQQWGQLYRAAGEAPLLSHLMHRAEAGGLGEKVSLIRDSLRAAAPGERQQLLEAYLQQEVARSLRLDPSQIDIQQSLDAAGLDSLMGLELKNRIATDLGVDLPMATLMQDPTISQLATQLLPLLTDAEHHLAPDQNWQDVEREVGELDQLSDDIGGDREEGIL
jgi:NADPH:quinone reductase-like Zn-dependent oxidoreductase/aryl carrier-like protein